MCIRDSAIGDAIEVEEGLVGIGDGAGDGVGGDELVLAVGPCLLYTSPSPRDRTRSRMPSSA